MTKDSQLLSSTSAEAFFQNPPLNWRRVKRKMEISLGDVSINMLAYNINKIEYECSISIDSKLAARFFWMLHKAPRNVPAPRLHAIFNSEPERFTLGMITFSVVKDKKVKLRASDGVKIYEKRYTPKEQLVPLGYSDTTESRFSQFCLFLISEVNESNNLYKLLSPTGLVGANFYVEDYFYTAIFAAKLSGIPKDQVINDFAELDGQIYWRGFENELLEPAILDVWKLTEGFAE